MYYIFVGLVAISSIILILIGAYFMILEVIGKGKADNNEKSIKFSLYGFVLGALAGYLINTTPLTAENIVLIGKFIFTAYLIITLHELGHFIAAKCLKLKTSTFSIGIGPKLFTFDRSNTLFKFHLFPMKGFVQVDTKQEEKLPLLFKCIFYLAGILVNIISFFIGLTVYFIQQGHPIIDSFMIVTKKFIAFIPKFYSLLTQLQFSDIVTPEHDLEHSIGVYISMADITQEFWLGFAVLSIIIAFFNTIPIPILDGGRVILAIFTSLLGLLSIPKKIIETTFYTLLAMGVVIIYSPIIINNLWATSVSLNMSLFEFLLWIGVGVTALINLQIFIENRKDKRTPV